MTTPGDTPDRATPTTKAGKALDHPSKHQPYCDDPNTGSPCSCGQHDAILAIEDEARDPDRATIAALREALERLLDGTEVDVRAQSPEGDDAHVIAMHFDAMDNARAVLAATDAEAARAHDERVRAEQRAEDAEALRLHAETPGHDQRAVAAFLADPATEEALYRGAAAGIHLVSASPPEDAQDAMNRVGGFAKVILAALADAGGTPT